MSYQEAMEDNIPRSGNGIKGQGYYPPCHICGTPVYSWAYRRGVVYTCPECRKELVAQERAEKDSLRAPAKERKLEEAVRRISRMTDIQPYEKGIGYIRKHLDHPGWFQSTEEIMVALELIRRGVKAHHQAKIFDYTVDFLLPDLKVALEIDGRVYHGRDREKKESVRDDVIAWKLGRGWEVVRIDTENVNRNVTKLLPGIRAVLNYRKHRKECT